MPRYDYKCITCDYITEIEHEMHWDEVILCYECRDPMKKLFTPVPGHFKGQGWGRTYRVHTPKKGITE